MQADKIVDNTCTNNKVTLEVVLNNILEQTIKARKA